MKSLLFFYLLLVSTVAFSNVIMDINGVKHSCTPMSSGTSPADCAKKAYAGPFNEKEAEELCSHSFSTMPAECAIKAYHGPLIKQEAIILCKYAQSLGPIECYSQANAGPFNKAESLELCSGNATLENAECALKAYFGPYTKEQSVKMCKQQYGFREGLRSSNLLRSFKPTPAPMQKEELEKLIIKNNIKAVRNNEYK